MNTDRKKSKTTNVFLWIAQGLVAAALVWAGTMKILQPQKLPFPWIQEHPQLAWITGIIDLSAGFGLVLPILTGVKPRLTLYAAYGTILLMIAASIFHISRNEAKDIGFNIFIIGLAIYIAWGRKDS